MKLVNAPLNYGMMLFLKNNDCMELANCPGRGAHALRPYSRVALLKKCLYYLLQIIKKMV
jgi:hypothetical protein